jgi:hypothetical protein
MKKQFEIYRQQFKPIYISKTNIINKEIDQSLQGLPLSAISAKSTY